MEKVRYLLTSLICIILLAGCNTKRESYRTRQIAKEVIPIPPPANISIEDLVSEWDTLRLEASSKSLLSDARRIQIIDDKLYVLDAPMAILYVFNKEGKYISKICDQGQGPEEYIKISDFEADKTNNRLLLVDAFSQRLFLYDTIGNLQKIIPLSFIPIHISSDVSQRFIHLNSTITDLSNVANKDHDVWIVNDNGSVTESFLDDDTPNRLDIGSLLSNNLTKDGELLYMPVFSEKVYRIHGNEAIVEYFLDNQTSEKELSIKDKKDIFYIYNHNNLEEYEKEGYFIADGTFFDNDKYFCLPSGWNKRMLTYFSKEHKKSISISMDKLNGNEALCELLMICPRCLDGEWFYLSISGDMITYLLPRLPKGKIRSFFESFTDDDNPYVIRYRLNPKAFEK